ncbi:MAG TPA: UDP-3-O-(3-hydroxymyristoyl)glucosamine N-acyltransferase [Steroidobacteraceae bacterium]|jgi:UDP-3-O-[3-hydroxymyristoyl] glucosamine N-acyltransferase|nr:UDP-3-O-(3-hydroxymyristoyl)glucosamine N-acyltransferase [Steroidobacteraceae bacterium]
MITAHVIKSRHSDVFTYLHGDLDSSAAYCRVPTEACGASLVFVSDAEQMAQAFAHRPAILVVLSKVCETLRPESGGTCCFSVKVMPIGMATLLKYFDHKCMRFSQWGQRHPTAVVHPDARIGQDVCLGPYSVIGARASIGDNTLIGSHVVIENDASIGARSVIHPQVFIGAGCRIGDDCEIHPHTTVGGDGFGYAPGPDGRARKIPHLGNVVIGNDVEIGSNCAIDRATLTSTHIRSGTKLDNICHIAHNCDLGEDGFYTAGFMMGGSTRIGRKFVTGGNSVVTAHVTVGDNVSLSGRSSVTQDVPNPGAYGGYPLQPLADAMRTAASLTKLNEIRKNLARVMRHLNLT